MPLTKPQENWFIGFWSYFTGSPRPATSGPMRAGWDAAQKCAESGHGGY